MSAAFFKRSRLDQGGFTLVELLVATSMMVILTGATVTFFISTVKNQSRITSNADDVGDARVAMRNIVDDIRQGSTITTAAEKELKLQTYIHAATCTSAPSATAAAIQCAITYKLAKEGTKSTYECTRKVESGTAVKVATGLSSTSMFIYSPGGTSSSFITAKLVIPASSGTGSTTLENGATLRNSTTALGY